MPSHENDTLEALDKIAIAFEEMISDYEERKRDRPYISPFYFGGDRLPDSSFTMQLGGIGLGDALIPRLGDFGDQVKESIESMQGAIKILALGIDYRRYLKFKGLTPRLTRYGARDWNIERRFDEEDKPSSEDARMILS